MKHGPLEAIFVERHKVDRFCYLAQWDGEGEFEINLTFRDGQLEKVEYADPAENVPRLDWKIKGLVVQLIENAERRLEDEQLPLVKPSSSDGAPGFETEIVDKNVFPDTSHYKLDELTVARERAYWKDPKNRNLTLGSRAEQLGCSGPALANALLGKSWNGADEMEKPLTRAQYNRALAQPKAYGK